MKNWFWLLCVAGPLWAAETTLDEKNSLIVSGVDHILASDSQDPLDPDKAPVDTFMHEATLKVDYGTTRGSLRFSNQFSPSVVSTEKHFNLEKKSLRHEWASGEAVVGDSHQELGRGIALSLYEDPVFGVDNTLEGLSVRFRLAGMEFGSFAGRINALEAPVAINPIDARLTGRTVYLIGSQASFDIGPSDQWGMHYLFLANEPTTRPTDLRRHTVGTHYTSQLSENIEAYAEANLAYAEAADRRGNFSTQPAAWGNFASVTYAPEPWKATLEFKDYRNFTNDFQRPPTLEEDIVSSINNVDVTAARLGVERRLGESQTTVFANWLSGQDRQYEAMVNHPVAGAKIKFENRNELEMKSGYRWISDRNHLLHGSAKTKLRTAKGQFLEIEMKKQDQVEALNSPLPIRTERNIANVTYTFHERFNVGAGWEYVPTNEGEIGQHFASLQGTYRTGELTVRGFLGETSGGVQCSAGVCRQVPPFKGGYVETTWSF